MVCCIRVLRGSMVCLYCVRVAREYNVLRPLFEMLHVIASSELEM